MAEKYRQQMSEILFLIIVAGFLIYGMLMELIEDPGILYSYPYILLLGLLMLKILIQGNSMKEWLLIIGCSAVGYFSWKGCQDRSSFLFMLTICACKNISPEKVIKIDGAIRVLSIVLHIVLAILQIAPNNVNVLIGGRERTFFSWGHPNAMGMSFLLLCIDWIYLRHKKLKWYEYVGMLIMIAFLDVTANSRTSEIIIAVSLILEAVCCLADKYKKNELMIIKYSCWGTFLMSVLAPIIGVILCKVLGPIRVGSLGTMGSRFWQTQRFIETHAFSFLGKAYTPDTDEYLDMLFANGVLRRGLLFGAILLFLSILAIVIADRKRNNRYLIVLFVLFLFGVAEQEHINLIYSIFPVLLGIPVWKVLEGKRVYAE